MILYGHKVLYTAIKINKYKIAYKSHITKLFSVTNIQYYTLFIHVKNNKISQFENIKLQ